LQAGLYVCVGKLRVGVEDGGFRLAGVHHLQDEVDGIRVPAMQGLPPITSFLISILSGMRMWLF